MPNQNNDNSLQDILELLSKEGLDGTGEALRVLLNAAMVLEREKYLTLLITNVMSKDEDIQMASSLRPFRPVLVRWLWKFRKCGKEDFTQVLSSVVSGQSGR
jgi:hypothetical protein